MKLTRRRGYRRSLPVKPPRGVEGCCWWQCARESSLEGGVRAGGEGEAPLASHGIFHRCSSRGRSLKGATHAFSFQLLLLMWVACFVLCQLPLTAARPADTLPSMLGSMPSAGGGRESHSFLEGEEVLIECRNLTTGKWSAGPICYETGRNISFHFGVNAFRHCGMELRSQEEYDDLVSLVKQEKVWHCRVAMSKQRTNFVPFVFNLWGHVEADHMRINNRINYVFHAFKGKIIAASAYPVLDHFQYVKVGGLVSMHGSIVWFHHHTFQSEAGLTIASSDKIEAWSVGVASGMFSSLLTFVIALIVYQSRLKPAIIRKCMKKE